MSNSLSKPGNPFNSAIDFDAWDGYNQGFEAARAAERQNVIGYIRTRFTHPSEAARICKDLAEDIAAEKHIARGRR